jgi:hypothetical protein
MQALIAVSTMPVGLLVMHSQLQVTCCMPIDSASGVQTDAPSPACAVDRDTLLMS